MILSALMLICHDVAHLPFFKVKTSLGALSKHFVGIELDSRVTLGSVTLVRVKSGRVTAIWVGDRYLRWMKLFMSMKKKQSQRLVYVALSIVIFNTLFNIMCV